MSEQNLKSALAIDQRIRKLVAEYYMSLKGMNDPDMAVKLLADHIAILVEMLNEFKGGA
ncbi:hypothetical protein ACFL20_10260 [Spirochaetota bacterium]